MTSSKIIFFNAHMLFHLICHHRTLMLQGNKLNQDFISALQPHKVVRDEYLESLGISVQMDPQTGKISATSSAPSPASAPVPGADSH
jgi:Spinocerebellar ataxia type 10 protein domain